MKHFLAFVLSLCIVGAINAQTNPPINYYHGSVITDNQLYGGGIDNALIPSQCAVAFAKPSWCYGSEMGAWINAAIKQLPAAPIGGEIQIPTSPNGCWIFTTEIKIDRPIHLVGQNRAFTTGGTCLEWNGSNTPAISVEGNANNAASHTIIQNMNIENTGTGTVGIDIINGQYNTTIRDVTIDASVGTAFSIAGIRIGGDASTVIDTEMDNIRIASQPVGLEVIQGNTITCFECHIYNSTTTNVLIGDVVLSREVNVIRFIGGNIENDNAGLGAPDFIITNAQSVFFTDLYTEIASNNTSVIKIASGCLNAQNIRWQSGYVNMNNATGATVLDASACSATDASLEGVNIVHAGSGSALFANAVYTSPSNLNAKNISSADGTLNSASTTSSTWIDLTNFIGLTSHPAAQTFGKAINQISSNNIGGSCTMSTSTSCTITIANTYSSPICIATQQSGTLTGGSVGCTVSGTTVTITSAISNSETWGALIFGNPN